MSGWYIKRDDRKYGPYSSTQLVEMAKKGQVLPIDWVARGESEQWMPASQVKGLFASSPQATVTPAAQATADPAPAVAISDPMGMGKKILGAIPASIFRPVVGMVVVIGLGLLASFFCGSLLLFSLSFFHIAAGVTCMVLAARLQKYLYAPLSALLTMTVWGWYCFSAVPLAVSILGLLAGIAVGVWALFVFRSADVKALFADAGKLGPLERLGTPVLAGTAGGLLVIILGIGGIRHMLASDKSNTNHAGGTGQSGGGNKKRGPENRKPGQNYLDDLVAKMGPPSRSYAKIDDSTIAEYSLHVWDAGGGFYDLVFTALPTKTNEPEFVRGTQSDVNKTQLDALLKGYRPK